MLNQAMEYTPEQIEDAEKLLQLMQGVPEARRKLYVFSIMGYIYGAEARLSMKSDNEAQKDSA